MRAGQALHDDKPQSLRTVAAGLAARALNASSHRRLASSASAGVWQAGNPPGTHSCCRVVLEKAAPAAAAAAAFRRMAERDDVAMGGEGETIEIRVARRIFVGNLSWQTSWQVGRTAKQPLKGREEWGGTCGEATAHMAVRGPGACPCRAGRVLLAPRCTACPATT